MTLKNRIVKILRYPSIKNFQEIFWETSDEKFKSEMSSFFEQGVFPAFTGALSEFNTLKVIRAFFKGFYNYQSYRQAQKFQKFCEQLQKGDANSDIKQYFEEIRADKEKLNQIVLLVLDQINKSDDDFKPQIIGELYKNILIRQKDYEKFKKLTGKVVMSHFSSFEYLFYFYKIYKGSTNGIIAGRFPYNESTLIISSGLGFIRNPDLLIFRDAIDICENGLKAFYDSHYEQIDFTFLERAFNDKKYSNIGLYSDFEKELLLQLKTSGRDPDKEWILNKVTVQKIKQYYSNN